MVSTIATIRGIDTVRESHDTGTASFATEYIRLNEVDQASCRNKVSALPLKEQLCIVNETVIPFKHTARVIVWLT